MAACPGLDGALIAIEKNHRKVWAFLARAHQRGVNVTVPAGVLAQVWRSNCVAIGRVLKGCVIEPLDESRAKAVGLLLGESRTQDPVDASVVLGAAKRRDAILTSDPNDLARLSESLGVRPLIIPIL